LPKPAARAARPSARSTVTGHFERIGRRGGQKVASLVERAKTLEGQDEQAKPAPEVRVEESIGA